MEWYFVRHGEIESNIRKVYAGWNDEGLTARGVQQAKGAGMQLKNQSIDNIFCSPLRRTMQTADIIGQIIGKQPIPNESFKELRLGVWEGMREDDVSRQFPEKWKIWNTRPAELVLDGRETLHELLQRVLNGIVKIISKVNDYGFLIVTHLAIIRILLLHTQKMDLNFYRTISVPNGEIFEINDDNLNCLAN